MKKIDKSVYNAAEIARRMGVTRQVVHLWLSPEIEHEKVPKDKVLEFEAITRIPRHEIRPDLFRKRKKKIAANDESTPLDAA